MDQAALFADRRCVEGSDHGRQFDRNRPVAGGAREDEIEHSVCRPYRPWVIEALFLTV